MAKKQKKKTKPKFDEDAATAAWQVETLQQVLDAMVKQVGGPLPQTTVIMSRVVGGEASGLLMGTHDNGKIDGAIYIHYSRLIPVVHAFQRMLHGWDVFKNVLDGVPDGKLPPQPGEENPEGAKTPPAPDKPSADEKPLPEVVVTADLLEQVAA